LKKDIINYNFWTEKLTLIKRYNENVLDLAQFYKTFTTRWKIFWDTYKVQQEVYPANADEELYDFNGNTPAIPTTISLTSDGGLVMEFMDYTGKAYSYKFPAP
jgi:hypothetical protein